MGAIQPWHIIIVVIVFLILFGSKKLPDAARGLGRSMRIFKSEVKEMQGNGQDSSAETTSRESDAEVAPRQIPPPSPTDATHETDNQRRSA